jgi:transcriptional regulator with XRE-family HTH domain
MLSNSPGRNHTIGIAEQLKYWRTERDLTLRQLSERSLVDHTYLNRLENNLARRPGRNIVLRVAIGLNLDVDKTNEMLVVAGHVPLIRRL